MNFKRTLAAAAIAQVYADPAVPELPYPLLTKAPPARRAVLFGPVQVPLGSQEIELLRWFTGGADPVNIARFRASTMEREAAADMVVALRASWRRAREGRCETNDWCRIASAINVGIELAKRGIASDRVAEFEAAHAAARAWLTRRQQRGSWTLYAQEITALDAALEIHEVQLQLSSRGELMDAYDAALAAENEGRARAARLVAGAENALVVAAA